MSLAPSFPFPSTMEHEHPHIIDESKNLKSEEKEEKEEEEEEEEEEILSLCDLPINHNSTSKWNSFDDTSFEQSLRQPSQETTLFEFFNGFSISEMCPADDIILCGKLVPFEDKDHSPRTHKNLSKEQKISSTHRRRSESLSKLQSPVTRSNSISTSRRLMMRNSRSLDYRRHHRSSSSLVSPAPEIDRICSARSLPSETAVKKAMKPRWYSLMFGSVKFPPEMELNDMKNRQVRRNQSTTMFPATDPSGKLAVNRSSGKVSWRILKALSCKDPASVAVTTSFALPQAS